jgi:hypothetical protein
MIRDAKPWKTEIDAITDLAIEALEIDAYEEMVINRERVNAVCRDCISSASHKSLVAVHDGVITGVAAGMVFPQAYYDRSYLNIVMWYSKSFGDGLKMMDQLMDWAEGRPMIKEIHYVGERKGGEKVTRFLCRRYGFRDDAPFIYRM